MTDIERIKAILKPYKPELYSRGVLFYWYKINGLCVLITDTDIWFIRYIDRYITLQDLLLMLQ